MGASHVKPSVQSEPNDLRALASPAGTLVPKHVSFADETTSQSQLSWSGVSGRFSLLSGRLSSFGSGSSRSASVRSAGGRPWSRVSRRRWSQATLEDPLHNCKTAWPVTLAESLFLPDFPIKDRAKEAIFEREKTLGSGAFGKVYQVKHRDSGDVFALKVLSKAHIVREGAIVQVKDEVSIQAACGHHPYIVGCPDRWQSRKQLFVLQELVSGGELRQLLLKHGSLHEELVQLYVAELATALDFLHNAGVIFRDLKLENVLLDDQMHVKLIDFGLAKWLRHGSRTQTLCGTLQYMAPELLEMLPYNHAVDWWSLGVLAFCLLTGNYPVPAERNHDEMRLAVLASAYRLPCHVSAPARALLSRLLTRQPRHRLTSALKLSRQAWFMNYPLDAVRAREVSARQIYDKYYAGCDAPSSEDVDHSEDFIDFDASTVDESLDSSQILDEFPGLPDVSPRRSAAAASTPNKTLDVLEADVSREERIDRETGGILSSPDSVVASSGVMSPHRRFVPPVVTDSPTEVAAPAPLVTPRRAAHDTFQESSSGELLELRLRDESSDGAECRCEPVVSETSDVSPAPMLNFYGTVPVDFAEIRETNRAAADSQAVGARQLSVQTPASPCHNDASEGHDTCGRCSGLDADRLSRELCASACSGRCSGWDADQLSRELCASACSGRCSGWDADRLSRELCASASTRPPSADVDVSLKRPGCLSSSGEEFDLIWKRARRVKTASSWEESSSEALQLSAELVT